MRLIRGASKAQQAIDNLIWQWSTQRTSQSPLVVSGGRLCRFSSGSPIETVTSESSSVAAESPLGSIVRHGSGDGVIVLNVGGKEFKTLRSTVASNSVLSQHVARAEANQEFTSGGSAVFIDREPKHFGVILQYLRNRVDGVTFSSSYKKQGLVVALNKLKHENNNVYAEKYVQLPKDTTVLKEIFAEASHYEIIELQDALCRQTFMTNVISTIGGGGNPFDTVNTIIKNARRGLVALGGVGTMLFGMQAGKENENGEKTWNMGDLAETVRKLVADG